MLTEAKTVTVNVAKSIWFVVLLARDVYIDTLRGRY